MTRPSSYRAAILAKCSTCRWSKQGVYRVSDLLCFHGDTISISRADASYWGACHVELYGRQLGALMDDEYAAVRRGRTVDPHGVCDEWEREPDAAATGGGGEE